ncbi:GAF domain-containing hybrid sensor histidine kinase/response regulator [Sphingobacterium detergens]|uniref:histidine kinase n=1 Tax=Sphingobacterium detergens TaxID=1145106 RepID=A0A420AIY3_SPHD1|nr:response regulator [Sphingobacterium detergens]RKE44441.1 signal transduction histidine kinase [Sphingobacterium detergens]
MDQENYRKQITIGVIISFLLIFISALYFFISLHHILDNERNIVHIAENRFNVINEIRSNIDEINDVKLHYFTKRDPALFIPYQLGRKKADESLRAISKVDDFYTVSPHAIETMRKEIALFYDFDKDIAYAKTNNGTLPPYIHEQKIAIFNQIDILSRDLLDQRASRLEKSRNDLQLAQNITYLFIAIGLSGFFYILAKIFSISKILRSTVKSQQESNNRLQLLQDQTNNDNWILNAINHIDEQLRGDYSDKKIAEISLNAITDMTKALGGTVYIFDDTYQEYQLCHKIGIASTQQVKKSIKENDGILGEVANKHVVVKIKDIDHAHLVLETSLSNRIETEIYIIPFAYENHCVGLMEICCPLVNEKEEQLRFNFLDKVKGNIAIILKVAQTHGKLADLYEELQQQTEELEAQQEELRTTNEELIHKTHLLEASEEELRVQQEELIQTNNELDEKAKLLLAQNEDLEKARQAIAQKIEEVELSSKYKSEFMANMSHELRTPLNSILILAKLLQDNKKENLNDDQIKYASVIHSAGSDLLHLINELLDLAKIESGKVEVQKEHINTNYLVNYIKDFFLDTAESKIIKFNVEIDGDTPQDFIGDEHRIQQVLKNLLSNAFKFTGENGTVSLKINVEDGTIYFTVQDNGIGIAPEKQELIFDAFKQEDGSTSRKYGGTGLGLSICREIASLLKGRITLNSKVGEGSVFIFSLPLEAEAQGEKISELPVIETNTPIAYPPLEDIAIGKEHPIDNSSKNNKLLIIEDDFIFADILKDYAVQNGYDVYISYDGQDGLNKARNLIPAAIILDIMLPKMDGWEVLRNLKKANSTKDIPVHMMSAGTFLHDEPISAGAIGFMSKPVSEESLAETFLKIKASTSRPIKKILLVEDQEIQSDFIKQSLEEKNIQIFQAFDARQALDLLIQEKIFDCIIMDLNLPDKSGIELLNEIKSNSDFKDLPIIINTAMELSPEQTSEILHHSQAMVLKSAKSNNRLIDEVNLFLNKIRSSKTEYHSFSHSSSVLVENNLASKTVLLADDDMRNIFALSTAFESYDMKIEIANNGQEALDILARNEHIDIVLMDIMMPVMDGYEAIEKIRENKKFSNLPIIAVTAKAMKGDREKTIAVGANDYISKPVDVDKLISLMRVWLS